MDYDKLIAPAAAAMRPSGIRKFFDLAAEMPECISLGVGEPDFKTPWAVREAGIESLEHGRTRYTSNAGLKELRAEIARYLDRRMGLKYDPAKEVLVTVGGSEAIDLIIHNGRVGEVYNVGGHNERTNLEVVKTILKALNKPESLIKFVTDRPGHDRRYAIDPTKLETELGWKPKYNFDTGIQQTIQWYLDNEDWWKHILSGEYSNYFDNMYGDRLGKDLK